MRIIEALHGLLKRDPKRLRALHVSLGLAGPLHNATSGELLFKPEESAKALGRIASEAMVLATMRRSRAHPG